MEKIYTIEGMKKEAENVKLVLNSNMVREKPNLLDIGKLQQQMTYQTIELRDPDQIRIPSTLWEKHRWNIGDSIKITVEEV